MKRFVMGAGLYVLAVVFGLFLTRTLREFPVPEARAFEPVVFSMKLIGWNTYQTQVNMFMRSGGDVTGDIVLYEDDVPLTRSDKASGTFPEALGLGSYRIEPVPGASNGVRKIVFSTRDGSDPRRNGRRYSAVIW